VKLVIDNLQNYVQNHNKYHIWSCMVFFSLDLMLAQVVSALVLQAPEVGYVCCSNCLQKRSVFQREGIELLTHHSFISVE
jgi:hypothetical protein